MIASTVGQLREVRVKLTGWSIGAWFETEPISVVNL